MANSAIGYKDVASEAVTSFESLNVGALGLIADSSSSNLFTEQLSSCFILRKPADAMNRTGIYSIVRTFSTPTDVNVASLLDVRVLNDAPWNSNVSVALKVNGAAYGGSASMLTLWNVFPDEQFIKSHHVIGSTIANAVSVALEVTMTGTAEIAISIGRLWAGPMWKNTGLTASGNRLSAGVIDPGEVLLSKGGQAYPRRQQKLRTMRFNVLAQEFDAAFGSTISTTMDLQRLAYILGQTEPCLAFPMSDSTQAIHRLGLYCTQTDQLTLTNIEGSLYELPLAFREIL